MKKLKFMAVIAATVLAFSMLITGCNSGGNSSGSEVDSKTDGVTVTFYDSDGKTVLKTEDVATGGTATDYTPAKEGSDFMGWFATPQLQHTYDFKQALTEDTSIFAGFVKFASDTREFAIVGSGKSPAMLSSNWGKAINDEHKMKKAANKNEYTITLDLYEGDEFQFVIDVDWHNQRGYGYLTTISKDDKEYFVNSGGLGDTSSKRSNIKVAVTGSYTFTLTTFPAEDTYETDNVNYKEENKEGFNISAYDKLEWVYNGETAEKVLDVQTNYYIKGAGITNWGDIYTDRTGFTVADGKHTLSVALKDGDEFMFTSRVTVGENVSVGTEYIRFSNLDEASAALFDKTDSYNMIAKAKGTYTFTYDPTTTVLTAVCDTAKFLPEYEYYMKGTFGATEWGTEGNKDYQLTETEAGSYVYVLKAFTVAEGDEMGLQSMKGSERIVFINVKSFATASDKNANADFTPHSNGSGNIVAAKAGTYTVTYNAYTGELAFTK